MLNWFVVDSQSNVIMLLQHLTAKLQVLRKVNKTEDLINPWMEIEVRKRELEVYTFSGRKDQIAA